AHRLGGKALLGRNEAGVQFPKPFGHGAELHVSLLQADAAFEARADEKKMALVGSVQIGLFGEEKVGLGLTRKIRSGDPYYGERLRVEPDRAADNAGITANATLPKAV